MRRWEALPLRVKIRGALRLMPATRLLATLLTPLGVPATTSFGRLAEVFWWLAAVVVNEEGGGRGRRRYEVGVGDGDLEVVNGDAGGAAFDAGTGDVENATVGR